MKRNAIRWEDVRNRLQASERSLTESLAETPERIKSAYRRRAAQLAAADATGSSASRSIPALVFQLAQEKYAIKLADLAEVLPFKGCTPVPGTSPKIAGVINVRGEIRPVIDLGLVVSEIPSSDGGFVLMLHGHSGLKVDGIEDLRDIRPEEFSPSRGGRYVQKVTEGPLMLIDIETVLSMISTKGVTSK